MRIDFYHLTDKPLERVLPQICEKLLSGGERLLIVGGAEQLPRIDRQLWTYSPDSFLPHGSERAESQPILLSVEAEAPNGARNVAIADGVWREEALGFDRVFYFFDSGSIEAARSAWRALNGREGTELHYWKQVDGKWVEGP